jgi:hypothetical protein
MKRDGRRDQRADHFEVAQLLGRDVNSMSLRPGSSSVTAVQPAHRSGEFALRAAELFEQQVREPRIGRIDAYRVLEAVCCE